MCIDVKPSEELSWIFYPDVEKYDSYENTTNTGNSKFNAINNAHPYSLMQAPNTVSSVYSVSNLQS
jgi:hypothetical protein